MLQQRICNTCSKSFDGGPRAYYCPSCRADRKREAKARYQERKRNGAVRPIGSVDACEMCGDPYAVEGGLQRFCPTCQPIHAAEYDRQTSLPFYHKKKDRVNPVRNEKRRIRSNRCLWCDKEFEPVNGSTTCSYECKRLLANKRQREYQERKKMREARQPEGGGAQGGYENVHRNK